MEPVPTTNTTLAYERWLAAQPTMPAGQTSTERVATILRAYGVAPAAVVADDPADRFQGTVDISASGVVSRFWCAECGPGEPVVVVDGWPDAAMVEMATREHDARVHGQGDGEGYPYVELTSPA